MLPPCPETTQQRMPVHSRAYRGVPKDYFDEAAEVGRMVFEAGCAAEKHYALDGLHCRLRYQSEALHLALHPALSHLEIAATSPDLSVNIWDESEVQPLLPTPHPLMLATYRGSCLEVCSNRRYLALDENWQGTRSYIDRQSGEAWHCVGDLDALPAHERSAPMRSVLNALLSARGRHLVHASAVGTPSGGVLLAGPARAGKSSTALSCLGGKLGYLADGWCGIRDDDVPGIFSVYACAKLRPDALERFPHLREKVDRFDGLDDAKALVFLGGPWKPHLLRSCAAKAILLPTITNGASTAIVPTPRKAAWNAVVSWSLGPHMAGCGPQSATLLTRFCAKLPAYEIRLGRHRDEIRETLESFVMGL